MFVACQNRHPRLDVVCKHWLRGLCKKDHRCEYLHIYDLSKMPPCQFFSTFGSVASRRLPRLPFIVLLRISRAFCTDVLCFRALRRMCSNGDECNFLHVAPETRMKDCEWYNRSV